MLNYEGVFRTEIADFITQKRACGYKYKEEAKQLLQFDKLTVKMEITNPVITKELVFAFTAKRENEAPKTQQHRCSIVRIFAKHLYDLGYEAYVLPHQKSIKKSSFVPYIFTHAQMNKILKNTDNMQVRMSSPYIHFTLPVIMRILYCCGLRISEVMNLKIKDVDMQKGILTIRASKFMKDRLIPMSPTLTLLCEQFLQKRNFAKEENDFFFINRYRKGIAPKTIYEQFRKLLWTSGISHGGRGDGPRLHDLRHTFAVHSLQKAISEGKDINAFLPIISKYLGHESIEATGKYLRLTAEVYPEIIATMNDFSKILQREESV